MNTIGDLPELRALDSRKNLIRIPGQQDIPVTDRVRRLIDSQAFQRLAKITQLGLVSFVYPGATHTRFEHSLGVYRNALFFLRRLSADRRFADVVSPRDAELLIAAALLHDIGHYPFCHPIEDMQIDGVPSHEILARYWIEHTSLADRLSEDWHIESKSLLALLSGETGTAAGRVLGSILSGPIDIDKMDYLYRDSLHAGVPYGMHYDQQRLIGSLCLDLESPGIAITEKGRTAAELMVFARYVMFSEVYWHHAVRSATAMFQRVFFEFHRSLDLDLLFRCSEQDFVAQLVSGTRNTPLNGIAESLFGNQRRLYKRLAQFSFLENQQIFRQLAQRPYTWLQDLSTALAQEFSSATGLEILPHEVLVDAPPVCLEVQFRVNVYDEKRNQQRPLGDVSPVVRVLAEQQFDNFVKRVRIFVPALHLDRLRQLESIDSLIERALETMAANSRERSDSETGTEQIDHRR